MDSVFLKYGDNAEDAQDYSCIFIVDRGSNFGEFKVIVIIRNPNSPISEPIQYGQTDELYEI